MSLPELPHADCARELTKYINSKDGQREVKDALYNIFLSIMQGKTSFITIEPSYDLRCLLESFGYKFNLYDIVLDNKNYSISWEENEENPDKS